MVVVCHYVVAGQPGEASGTPLLSLTACATKAKQAPNPWKSTPETTVGTDLATPAARGVDVTHQPPPGLFRPLHAMFSPPEQSVYDQNW